MSPLHIKLRLMRNFVKAKATHPLNIVEFLCKKFPKVSQAKLKEEIILGPQIRKVFKKTKFETALNRSELRVWHVFK